MKLKISNFKFDKFVRLIETVFFIDDCFSLTAGVIDEDYRGNVGVILFNFSKVGFVMFIKPYTFLLAFRHVEFLYET